MSQTVVKANVGREKGSRPSRRLRAEGMLPGVVYGLDKEPISVAVKYTDLRDALNNETGMNTVFQLDIDGGASETVLVRSVQRDPIKRVVTHADFMRVDPAKPIKLRIPIRTVGDGVAVTSEGGMIEQKRFELEVLAAPDAIPDAIEADLDMLTLDRRISVGDLNLPAGVTSLIPDEITVVSPVLSRAAKVGGEGDEFDDEDGEAGEGAEAEADGGDAEAGDDGDE